MSHVERAVARDGAGQNVSVCPPVCWKSMHILVTRLPSSADLLSSSFLDRAVIQVDALEVFVALWLGCAALSRVHVAGAKTQPVSRFAMSLAKQYVAKHSSRSLLASIPELDIPAAR